MSAVRFYVRHADGGISDDQTCPIETPVIRQIEKGFSVIGESATFVIEFDPPLIVPEPVEEPEL